MKGGRNYGRQIHEVIRMDKIVQGISRVKSKEFQLREDSSITNDIISIDYICRNTLEGE